jgi:hypothetical protein
MYCNISITIRSEKNIKNITNTAKEVAHTAKEKKSLLTVSAIVASLYCSKWN